MKLYTPEMTPARLAEETTQHADAVARREVARAQVVTLSREIDIRARRIKRLRAHLLKHPHAVQNSVPPDAPTVTHDPNFVPRWPGDGSPKKRRTRVAPTQPSGDVPDFLKRQAAPPKTDEEFVKDFAKKLKAEPVMSNEDYERLYGHLPKE